ncbi:hypothetical protein PILCRDRAFT_827840 [Piloderma croceum F 1598]|uniref:Uncharacterized protein n=1 Tax=Piloderma croceum (strain F 1598) TaxID=765440 RepID=A0A0C3F412_PILCF|nr:hypothetical protein PILCRDRAFT_827840 [Piloderma croceum F 1598]
MPQWAVVTIGIVICLALALALIVLVGGIGQFVCGRRDGVPSLRPQHSHARSRDQYPHPQSIADDGGPNYPATASVDTITLTIIPLPPPAYVYPPQYHHNSRSTADAMERGQAEGAIGAAF